MDGLPKAIPGHVTLLIPQRVAEMKPKRLSMPAKMCFGDLWLQAGCRAGHVTTSYYALARPWGADERTAKDWVAKLSAAKMGLVEVISDDPGRLRLYVNDPGRVDGDALLLEDDDADRQLIRDLEKRDREEAGSCARNSPGNDAQNSPPELRVFEAGSTACEEARTDRGAELVTGVGSEASGRSEHAADEGSASGIDAGDAGSSARKSPAPHIHGKEDLRLPMDHGDGSTGKRVVAQQGGPAQRGEPQRIGVVLEKSLEQMLNDIASPDERLERLAHRIANVVRDPDTHWSIFERAAEAVVKEGLYASKLERILADVKRKRREGTIQKSTGGYFLFRIRKACKSCKPPITLFDEKPKENQPAWTPPPNGS